MKAQCSAFAKTGQYMDTQKGFYQYQRSLVEFTARTNTGLVRNARSQRKRCCLSFCLMQRQGTLPHASVKTEKVEREKLLHAAALLNAENSNEAMIEKVIYGCRFMTFLGIIGSLMGSVICFLKGCVYVFSSFVEHFHGGGKVITMLIEAIDIYLIGTVMLVFGMGLYELFICNFDVAKASCYGSNLWGLFCLAERPKWLEIKSVNELKTKLGHVIVMVLLIGLFENSKKVTIRTTTDLLCFAASILISSGCLFLLSKLQSAASKETNRAPKTS